MKPQLRDETGDTIVAVSTAIGLGAIGIVRVSGPDALRLGGLAFRPARGPLPDACETYRMFYGHVVDPEDGQVLDEALLAVMRTPHSYTREDVVELHCHGGVAAQRAVLRLLVRLGARPAEPGEFTRRAFMNGRIDLTQAESVAGIVAARSSGALRASVRQLDGGLSNRLRELRKELVGLLACIEAAVDFSDEDLDEVDWGTITATLVGAREELARLLRTGLVGRALECGVRTAIVGRPNVGKSSLLNALLMRERAIVSQVPGTTRDTVEELLEIGGIPVHLVDTAGIRRAGDDVELLGVERSLRALEQADLVLAVVDMSVGYTDEDRQVLGDVDRGRAIVVGNKLDLAKDAPDSGRRLAELVRHGTGVEGAEFATDGEAGDGPAWRLCAVSSLTGEGIDTLRSMIEEVVTGGEGLHLEEPILATERQRALVAEALERVEEALGGSEDEGSEELVCEDIRAAAGALGRVTGEDLTADLLDEIFSRFCIGK